MTEPTDPTPQNSSEFEQRAEAAKQRFKSDRRAGKSFEEAKGAALRFYEFSPAQDVETGEWFASTEAGEERPPLSPAKEQDQRANLAGLLRWLKRRERENETLLNRAQAPGGIGELATLGEAARTRLVSAQVVTVREIQQLSDYGLSRRLGLALDADTISEIGNAVKRWGGRDSPADELAVAHRRDHSVYVGESGAASAHITGSATITEADDALAAELDHKPIIGDAAITEDDDTIAATATAPAVGSLAKTEAADTIAATAPSVGSLALAEASEGLGSAPTPLDREGRYQDWLVRHPKRGAQAEFCENLGIYPGDLRKWRKRQKFKDNSAFSLKIITGLLQ